jgi:hypothetical protein
VYVLIFSISLSCLFLCIYIEKGYVSAYQPGLLECLLLKKKQQFLISRLRHEIVSKELVKSPETNGQKPPTKAGFPVPTSRDGGIWEDLDKDGETKNTLRFKGTGHKT